MNTETLEVELKEKFVITQSSLYMQYIQKNLNIPQKIPAIIR